MASALRLRPTARASCHRQAAFKGAPPSKPHEHHVQRRADLVRPAHQRPRRLLARTGTTARRVNQPLPTRSSLSALSPASRSRASASPSFASRASATAAAWSRISRRSARATSVRRKSQGGFRLVLLSRQIVAGSGYPDAAVAWYGWRVRRDGCRHIAGPVALPPAPPCEARPNPLNSPALSPTSIPFGTVARDPFGRHPRGARPRFG